MIKDKEIHDIILIHVARTWERIRLEQPHQEMPSDNIESANSVIPEIAYVIYKTKVIQKLINYDKDDWSWSKMTNGYADFSDTYIEQYAYQIIHDDYLNTHTTEYKTCDKCCYDIVDNDGDVMEHHCVDDYVKELKTI